MKIWKWFKGCNSKFLYRNIWCKIKSMIQFYDSGVFYTAFLSSNVNKCQISISRPCPFRLRSVCIRVILWQTSYLNYNASRRQRFYSIETAQSKLLRNINVIFRVWMFYSVSFMVQQYLFLTNVIWPKVCRLVYLMCQWIGLDEGLLFFKCKSLLEIMLACCQKYPKELSLVIYWWTNTNRISVKIDVFMQVNYCNLLTHLPLVLHICVNQLGQHWFR